MKYLGIFVVVIIGCLFLGFSPEDLATKVAEQEKTILEQQKQIQELKKEVAELKNQAKGFEELFQKLDKRVKKLEEKTVKDNVIGGKKLVGSVKRGEELHNVHACSVCHSINGSKVVGPSYKGLYGSTKVVMEKDSEKKIVVDDTYLEWAIRYPTAQIVKGYPSVMPSYSLTDQEIQDLVTFIKACK